MRDALLNFLVLPMPVLWLLVLGAVLWRWTRSSRALMLSATLLLLVASLPVSGAILSAYLVQGAPRVDAYLGTWNLSGTGPIARENAVILVPTAGSFEDGSGRWWASANSVLRATAGRRLQKRLGVPLIIAGGSPRSGQPPEAETIAAQLGIAGPDVWLEPTARNSSETGTAVAAMLAERRPNRRIILVTSPVHIARMSAALRHEGLEVSALTAGFGRSVPGAVGFTPFDFLPSRRGFKTTQNALWEYLSIAWYLLTGRLDPADL